MERTLFDRFVNSAFRGRRVIGKPMRYNMRTQDKQGWVELVCNPRTRSEEYVSNAYRFVQPYLAAFTYRFHAEKAREAGIRVEDVYCNKFHKEPYVMFHLYAQYFHPETLLERVREIAFYRQPRRIFKGFRVPDWAQAQNFHGWDVDLYSRKAWNEAQQDLRAEWTPTQFRGERQEPNILQWFRMEQYGDGNGERLFYNEVPNTDNYKSWWRLGGHYTQEDGNHDAEQNRRLHSFTYANQDRPLNLGSRFDTTTPEGREAFKAEWDRMCDMYPEMMKKEDICFPHELAPKLVNEPHFLRAWQHYREHIFKLRLAELVDAEGISKEDADAFRRFCGGQDTPAFHMFILAKQGRMEHLRDDADYQATLRVMTALGWEAIEIETTQTAKPAHEQFWEQFDAIYDLTEASMREDMPLFISDPANRAKFEAMEQHRQLN